MRLRIWLPSLAELRAESMLGFEVLDAQRHVRNRGETVIAGLPHGIDCELVLHATDVVLLDVRLPKLSGARLAGALPALVEERVVGDIEASHVVASARDAQGSAVAAVVDRSLLRRALELFQRAGHRVIEATAAPLASPHSSGVWHVRLRDGHGSVRTGAASGMGFTCSGKAPLELRLLVAQTSPKPDAIEVDGDCDAQEWNEALAVPVKAAPAATTAPPITLDLLQYEFSRSVVSWRAWRTTLVLGVALLVAAVGGLNLQAWKLRAQEKSLRERMVSIVKETFTQVPVVLDPLVQMRRYVSDLRAGAGTETGEFLSLATALGHAADGDSMQSMDYRDGHFIVRFRPEAASTDAQRTALGERAARAGIALSFSGDGAQLARKAEP
jgi:general secretion pathway protein L